MHGKNGAWSWEEWGHSVSSMTRRLEDRTQGPRGEEGALTALSRARLEPPEVPSSLIWEASSILRAPASFREML